MNLAVRAAVIGSRRGILSPAVDFPATSVLGSTLLTPRLTRAYGGSDEAKAAPEPLRGVAAELWTDQQVPQTLKPDSDPNALLQHPLYTPPMKPQTGIGPLIAPLKWPEYDQKMPSSEESGLPSPPNWHDRGFDDPVSAPIGDYPRIRPQFAQLRDPFKYWDQQGRREYGEVLYDHDNFTDMWSIGPEVHWWVPFKHCAKLLGIVALMGACVHWWDPEKHLWFAEKDYPFNGLRVELGGDPNDENDTFHRTNVYKI
ncbi:uncharacterized protein SPPG_01023 [Spizellomyces punctatus DAOM BR117]|uniref:NADH dehydrogenase [ubiquinone] 1 beta subcomplex subunit 8, mitochondrial n=1 Tax=Spizellomyces punctatus (strain DAOM BR117) TaxID=645134 RepID=A0A0L0HQ49_SPIPD|nr:uncharacterized protein SPPG_01023 [Spizellomyces punctatus DAOM BR117]KND03546.1 hypothetical protein SPPG_01023 [Spizellomyces punctatus DAOM BR117]|eukprot:XP_016611585.1 hypothetical protein SPPG_01023 [Spizellomyces punctatus DAOM BR117]